MLLDEDLRGDLVTRLNRVEGQLRGISRMIQQPRSCIEILQQLAAAEAALGRVSHAIVKFHVEKCIPSSLSQGTTEQLSSLTELVDIFDKYTR